MSEIIDMKPEPTNGKDEPKPLIMTITMTPEGKMEVGFPMLNNQVFSYGFLKLAEKTLDNFYKEVNKPMIHKSHGIIDFVRKH